MATDNLREIFIAECMNRGFTKQGSVLFRCVGDAIFQRISVIPTKYQSYDAHDICYQGIGSVIKFDIWSMYSSLSDFFFCNKKHLGEFYPEDFLGSTQLTNSDNSLKNAYNIMLSTGLPMLDSITTQEKLLSTVLALQRAKYGTESMHRCELCAPYVLCGDYQSALVQLYGLYAQSWLNFHHRYDHLKHAGNIKKYIHEEQKLEIDLMDISTFLERVLGRKYEELVDYFRSNLSTNIIRAKKQKIAFSESFAPLFI